MANTFHLSFHFSFGRVKIVLALQNESFFFVLSGIRVIEPDTDREKENQFIKSVRLR
jgi:hypothetical protein